MKWSTLYTAECRHWLRSPLFWLSFLLLLIAPMVAFLGTMGVFDPRSTPDLSGRQLNAPLEIYRFLHFFQPVLLAGAALIAGQGWYRDLQYRFHDLICATPISATQYITARSAASLTLIILWTTAPGIGLWAAEHWPGLHPGSIGDHHPEAYLHTYATFTWPNATIAGMVAFLIVRWTREITPVFIGLVLFWVYQQLVSTGLERATEWQIWLDPTGHYALQQATQTWESGDAQPKGLPVTPAILGNRLWWLGVWSVVFGMMNRGLALRTRVRAGWAMGWPKIKSRWLFSSVGSQLIADLGSRVWYYALILAGLGLYTVVLNRTLHRPEIDLLPYMPMLVSAPLTLLSQVWLGVIVLMTHHLAYMDRRSGMWSLIDATSATNWQVLFGRLGVLWIMAGLLTLLSIVVGLVSQWLLGPVPITLGAWIQYGLYLGSYLVCWSTLALCIQWLVRLPFLGLLIVGGSWMLGEAVGAIGWWSPLWTVGGPAYVPYSDWLGFGEAGLETLVLRIFWLLVSLFLAILAVGARSRGYEEHRFFSLAFAKKRRPRFAVLSLVLLLCLTAGSGYWIHQQASRARAISHTDQKEYQERYQTYAHLLQPTIQHLDLQLDFFPGASRFQAQGTYRLRNEEGTPIDTIVVQMGYDEITDFHLSVPADTLRYDPEYRVLILQLAEPLLSKAEVIAHFLIRSRASRLFDRYLQVTHPISFLGQDILPRFTLLAKADTLNTNEHYQGGDADRITWSINLTSEAGHALLAPGELVEQGVNSGRSYARFRSDRPGKLSLGFFSGRYRKSVADDSLEVWYHPRHEAIVPKLHSAQRTGLQFLTTLYGPYGYNKNQVIAFHRALGTHATAYGQVLPVSEVRWWADTTAGAFFLPGYMVMHELAHHWWGQQLLPASGPGATFLTESMAEYLSLRMLEQAYGGQALDYFLHLQRDRYLRGHRHANKEELPLVKVEAGQQYLAYAKGALTLRTLAAYLGQDTLDQVMRRFMDDHRFREAPYPTAGEWVDELLAVAPDSLRTIVEERLERTLLHQATLHDVQIRSERKGISTLDMQLTFTKNDENDPNYRGAAEWLEIEALDKAGQPIARKRFWLPPGQHQIEWGVSVPPARIVLDPSLLLLEKDRSDNTILLE